MIADDECLNNIIFNKRLFSDNSSLEHLRVTIAAAINMGAASIMYGQPQKKQINPIVLNEWYYIMKAIKEAGLANSSLCNTSFVEQMVDWFPMLFPDDTIELFNDSKRKMANAISSEKRYWKQSKTHKEILLKDMWKKDVAKILGYEKANRIYEIACKGLLMNLTNLKHEIEKKKQLSKSRYNYPDINNKHSMESEKNNLLKIIKDKDAEIDNLRHKLEQSTLSKEHIVFNGDYIAGNKHVGNEVGHVDTGATGITINNKEK